MRGRNIEEVQGKRKEEDEKQCVSERGAMAIQIAEPPFDGRGGWGMRKRGNGHCGN